MPEATTDVREMGGISLLFRFGESSASEVCDHRVSNTSKKSGKP